MCVCMKAVSGHPPCRPWHSGYWPCWWCFSWVGPPVCRLLRRTARGTHMCPQVRKGMVLVDERLKPVASWEFDASISVLTHSTTIQPRYQVSKGGGVRCALGP